MTSGGSSRKSLETRCSALSRGKMQWTLAWLILIIVLLAWSAQELLAPRRSRLVNPSESAVVVLTVCHLLLHPIAMTPLSAMVGLLPRCAIISRIIWAESSRKPAWRLIVQLSCCVSMVTALWCGWTNIAQALGCLIGGVPILPSMRTLLVRRVSSMQGGDLARSEPWMSGSCERPLHTCANKELVILKRRRAHLSFMRVLSLFCVCSVDSLLRAALFPTISPWLSLWRPLTESVFDEEQSASGFPLHALYDHRGARVGLVHRACVGDAEDLGDRVAGAVPLPCAHPDASGGHQVRGGLPLLRVSLVDDDHLGDQALPQPCEFGSHSDAVFPGARSDASGGHQVRQGVPLLRVSLGDVDHLGDQVLPQPCESSSHSDAVDPCGVPLAQLNRDVRAARDAPRGPACHSSVAHRGRGHAGEAYGGEADHRGPVPGRAVPLLRVPPGDVDHLGTPFCLGPSWREPVYDAVVDDPRRHVPVVDPQHDSFCGHSRMFLSLPALATWNTRGLFSTDVVLQARKLHILGTLCATTPIVCLQECHGSRVDWEHLIPHSRCCVSFHPLAARGGVAIVMQESFVHHRQLEMEEIEPGRCVAVTVGDPGARLSVYCLHLEGEDHDLRSKMALLQRVGEAVKRCPSELTLLVGDFNCEWPEDALGEKSSWGHTALSREIDGWFGGWTRIIPPCPTYVGTSVSPARFLDCFLVNTRYSFAKEAMLAAATVLVHQTLEPPKCSDHLPVRLMRSCDNGNRPPSFPAFLASNVEWSEDVREYLTMVRLSSLSGDEGLGHVNQACQRARKHVCLSQETLPVSLESDVYHLQTAIRHWLRERWQRLVRLLERAPHWGVASTLTKETGTQLDRLLLHKKELLALERDELAHTRAKEGKIKEHHLRSFRLRWMGVLGAWKKQRLCSQLAALSVHGGTVDSHSEMLSALTDYWSPLAAAVDRDTTPIQHEVLGEVVEVHWSPMPCASSIDVRQFLECAPSTAAGPDGLMYSHLLAAGVEMHMWIANMFNDWIAMGIWPKALNASYMVPIPKSSGLPLPKPEDVRPITLMNTVAKVCVSMLSRYLYSNVSNGISQFQHGALPGRRVEDLIIGFESACFRMSRQHEQAAIVLLDIQRAYPSVSREFIDDVLLAAAAPHWLIRAIACIHKDQLSAFVLGRRVGEWFVVARGVRQGCPLSSLLFCWSFDCILRWMAKRCPIPLHISAYCDDVSLVLSQLHGRGAIFLGVLVRMFDSVAQLTLNFQKVRLIPLASSLCGQCVNILVEQDEAWSVALEVLSSRLLGFRVGPQSCSEQWDDVVCRLETRASLVGAMGLGAPAAVRLALSVVWTVAFHCLSMHLPSVKLEASFRMLFQHLITGPRGWMNPDIAQVLGHLGWPSSVPSVPSLADLSLKLRLGVISRSGRLDILQVFNNACDHIFHLDAPLVPFLGSWVKGGALAALAKAAMDAETLGILSVSYKQVIRFRSPFRGVLGTRGFSSMVAKHLRQQREAALLPTLHAWFAKRLALHGGAWTSHVAMLTVLRNLRRVRTRCAPRIMNVLIRCLTSGVSLETSFQHSGRCLLSPRCGGGHSLQHYLWSSCWHTEIVQRRLKQGLRCLEPFKRNCDVKLLVSCANATYLLSQAINLARNTLDDVPFPVERVLRMRVARAGFRRGHRRKHL